MNWRALANAKINNAGIEPRPKRDENAISQTGPGCALQKKSPRQTEFMLRICSRPPVEVNVMHTDMFECTDRVMWRLHALRLRSSRGDARGRECSIPLEVLARRPLQPSAKVDIVSV
jgi:hypothetical protein